MITNPSLQRPRIIDRCDFSSWQTMSLFERLTRLLARPTPVPSPAPAVPPGAALAATVTVVSDAIQSSTVTHPMQGPMLILNHIARIAGICPGRDSLRSFWHARTPGRKCNGGTSGPCQEPGSAQG